jgi:hypothetical protein
MTKDAKQQHHKKKKKTKKAQEKSKIITLQRIARLWDEQWLDAIGGQANDVSSRLAKLADWGARIKAKDDMDAAAKVWLLTDLDAVSRVIHRKWAQVSVI